MKNNRLIFKTFPSLVSVDGPDGTGKSTFSEVLAVELGKKFGKNKIKLVRPTCFSTSAKAQRIGNKLGKAKNELKEHSQPHNAFFLAAIKTNYESIVLPVIEQEQIVVLDSSEIRALAFMIDKGNRSAIKDTETRIKNGVLTCSTQPKMRIILMGEPHELWKNLLTKDSLDRGDPQNIPEVKKRIVAYKKAIELIQRLETNEEVKWVNINIQHVTDSLSDYLVRIIRNQIILPYSAKILGFRKKP